MVKGRRTSDATQSVHQPQFALRTAWIWPLVLVLLAGCSLGQDAPPVESYSATSTLSTTPTPAASMSPTGTQAAVPSATPVPTAPLTLTIWLPAQMTTAAGDGEGPAAVAALNDAFQASEPDTHIEVVPKAQYGSGGMVDMLLATQATVPERLPAIAVVDVSEMAQLMDSDLLIAVDDLSQSAAAALPETVRQAVSRDERTFGVPFEADILMLAYNPARIDPPPTTWQDLIAGGHTLALPLRDGDGSAANAFLLQYAAAGGEWTGTPPSLDAALMATLLQSYVDAATAGSIPQKMLAAGSSQECWTWYLEGNADMCVIESSHYLADRSAPGAGAFAAVPTRNGATTTMARAWAWVITATDGRSAEMAGQYIDYAMTSQALSQWLLASHDLPLGEQAAVTDENDGDETGYSDLADQLLQTAAIYPNSRYYPQMQAIISEMISSVLSGDMAPERAAVTAATAISSLR